MEDLLDATSITHAELTEEDTVDIPNDISLGEVYRMLVALDRRMDTFIENVHSRTVATDVYAVAHAALTDRVIELEKHNSIQDASRRNLTYAVIGASLTAVGSFVLSVVGHAKL